MRAKVRLVAESLHFNTEFHFTNWFQAHVGRRGEVPPPEDLIPGSR